MFINLKSTPIKFSVVAVVLWASAQGASSAPANDRNGVVEPFKWNDALQQWDDPCTFITDLGWLTDTSLLPGEGGLIQNYSGQPFTVTFIGEVLQGYLTKSVPAGLSIRSSMVPQTGGITTLLGFGPEDGLAAGDKLNRYDNLWGDYVIYTYNGADWYRTTPPPPTLLEPAPTMGEAFWFETLGPRTWRRTFSVWP